MRVASTPWSPGRKATAAVIESIDGKLNWVILVNVLNAFLGVPIDMLTGAWMNLTPERMELTLPAAE
jgi:hypothetical protein